MNPPADPLAELRPLHLPDPVSWWPPAPGWWLVLLIALAGLVVAWLIWRRRAPRRAALRELRVLEQRALPEPQAAAEVSALLRRYALLCYPHDDVAGLSGQRWLGFLDSRGGHEKFTGGPGRVLEDAPFRATGEGNVSGLYPLAAAWIRRNPVRRRAA